MRLIAFDLDDTLYKERDFVKSGYRYIARLLAARYGFNEEEMVRTMLDTQLNPFDSLEEYLTNRSVQRQVAVSEDIPWMVETYRNHLPDIELLSGVADTLRTLKAEGNRLALITDGRESTQANKVKALSLYDYIDPQLVSISEVIGAEKYYPDAFERMMWLNPDCDSFVYVGDNPMKDFVWPNRLGWLTVQVEDDGRNVHSQAIDPHHPDYLPQVTIKSIIELPTLLSSPN